MPLCGCVWLWAGTVLPPLVKGNVKGGSTACRGFGHYGFTTTVYGVSVWLEYVERLRAARKVISECLLITPMKKLS